MGDEPIIIEQFFYGFEGVIMGSIMGSQNIMGSDYGSNISGAGAEGEKEKKLGQAITKALTCWFSDDDLNVLL
jgi:hypothetical protein